MLYVTQFVRGKLTLKYAGKHNFFSSKRRQTRIYTDKYIYKKQSRIFFKIMNESFKFTSSKC